MQFPTLLLFTTLSATLTGALTTIDDVVLRDITVHNVGGKMTQVTFTIDADDNVGVTCDVKGEALYNSDIRVKDCSLDAWSFYIKEKALDAYTLYVYEQVGDVSGVYGVKTLTMDCALKAKTKDYYICLHKKSDYHLTVDGTGNQDST